MSWSTNSTPHMTGIVGGEEELLLSESYEANAHTPTT